MLDALRTYVSATPGSPLQELAGRHLARDEELERQAHDGPWHSYMAHAEELEKAAGQWRLELDDYDSRANVRSDLAAYLEREVLPELEHHAQFLARPQVSREPESTEEDAPARHRRRKRPDPQLAVRRLASKLLEARRKCWFQLDTTTGETRTLWDHKAGEPLLCPDDAREEAMRLQRRLVDTIGDLERKGYRVYYGVLTIDNAPPGLLKSRIESLWKKFRRAMKARIEPHGPGPHLPRAQRAKLFPIVGAIAVLEAPLSASRTWHPHLNVIAITKGFFDWEAWSKHWNCWSRWQAIRGGRGQVEAAFRELIKYSVRAVPEKSREKASCSSSSFTRSAPPAGSSSALSSAGSSSEFARKGAAPMPGAMAFNAADVSSGLSATLPTIPSSASGEAPGAAQIAPDPKRAGPAMTEWAPAEWFEWWGAMKGRRRTRTYGELFGINLEDDSEESGQWITIGSATWDGRRYKPWYPLLSSIPGDKSILNPRRRWEKWLRETTGPPGEFDELAQNLRDWQMGEEFARMSP